MKRYALVTVLCLSLSLSAGEARAALVQDSKHNLSSTSTNAVKAANGSTAEICVFCHTPHSARADAPLWNRTEVSGGYTLYNKAFSDVLSQLGGGSYPDAEDPSTGAVHVKTRICLSCHDGTIALGNLVNLPQGFSSNIPMQGANLTADYRLADTSAGKLGLDLRDDHPVAIPHDKTKDPELNDPSTFTKVRVYGLDGRGRATAININGNYVECTSCHDAHDNQYGNFLIDSNSSSKICTSCHTKQTGAGTPAHDNSAVAYDPDGTGSIGNSVGTVKCMNCHYSHRAGATGSAPPFTANPGNGRYLLSFQEETTCFNNAPDQNRWGQTANVCHGSGSSGKDIQSAENKGSAHKDAPGYSGKHRATEHGQGNTNYGWLGSGYPSWHVECGDCHNPHSAGNTNHTPGTNQIANASPLYGAGGVSIAYPLAGNWAVPAQANYSSPGAFEELGATNSAGMPANYYEYQICFKCHSSFAWGGIPGNIPPSPSLGGGSAMTDQAQEFNTANASFHPVAGGTGRSVGTLIGWTNKGFQTMYCSECHSNNGGAPIGPHGSNSSFGDNPPITRGFLLVSNYTDTYSTTRTNSQPNDLCSACHDPNTYLTGPDGQNRTGTGFSGATLNLHLRHANQASLYAASTFAYRCVNCHTRIPHGYRRKAMIVVRNEGAPYEAGGTGLGKITAASLAASGTYLEGAGSIDSNCTTVTGCHH